MNSRDEHSQMVLSIAAVERDTGIGKDTLRVWERRYRFPEPGRDANGERIYPLAQVEKPVSYTHLTLPTTSRV